MAKYLVNAAEQKTTSRGSKYITMTLYAVGGKSWKSMWWDAGDPPPVGSVVDVLAEIDNYQGAEQLKVTALRVLDEDPSDTFLPRTKYDVDALYAELVVFSKSVENEKLANLLYKAVGDPRWKRSPAATQMHHAFLGGLLEHSVNLCRLADAVAKLYPGQINRDLLICGAILHDIGKMDELSCGITLEYSNIGRLQGHISIGFLRVNKWMDELEFDDELRMVLSHLLLAHHGNKSFGSPVEPATLEAQVFSNLDGLDANIGKWAGAVAKTAEGKEWTEPVEFKTKYYLGKKT